MNYGKKQFIDLFRYDIPRFIKNVFVYRKVLFHTYPFDYVGSLYFMREHFKQLEPVLRNGYHVQGPQTADKVKTCILLLDRILECTDQYGLDRVKLDMSNGRCRFIHTPKNTEHPRYGTKTYWEIIKNKENNDWELLMKLLNKHLRSFWD